MNKVNKENLPVAARIIDKSRRKAGEKQRRLKTLNGKRRVRAARVKHEQTDMYVIAIASSLVCCPPYFSRQFVYHAWPCIPHV